MKKIENKKNSKEINELFEEYYYRTKKLYQEKFTILRNSCIAVIGLGGLGSFTAELLARTGINLILVDYDKVEISNLSRQNYELKDIGTKKSEVLFNRLSEINPSIKIKAYDIKLDSKNGSKLLEDANIIMDCVDNFETRFELDKIKKELHIPLIHMAVEKDSGTISFLNEDFSLNQIYNIKKPNQKSQEIPINPLLPTLTGLVGASMAINYLLYKKDYSGYVYRINLKDIEINKFKIKR